MPTSKQVHQNIPTTSVLVAKKAKLNAKLMSVPPMPMMSDLLKNRQHSGWLKTRTSLSSREADKRRCRERKAMPW